MVLDLFCAPVAIKSTGSESQQLHSEEVIEMDRLIDI